MTDNQLTQMEKATLLGHMDGRCANDFDKEFSAVIEDTPPLGVDELDGQIRRSLVRYTEMVVDDEDIEKIRSDNDLRSRLRGIITVAFLHGYQVSIKWGKPIVRDQKSPSGTE